jgi:N-acetylneuraminate lyase
MCRTATTFAPDGSLDEAALGEYLARFVDTDLGVYLASAGSGEGYALTTDERRRVYRVGVEVGAGQISVNANPPEQHTAAGVIEQSRVAAEAGVDVVNVYGPTAWHGYRPSADEMTVFFDEVLSAVRHPVAISSNAVVTTPVPATLLADLCRRYPQVTALNLMDVNDAYYVALRDALTRDVAIYVPVTSSYYPLAAGATGLVGAEANLAPRTYRAYLDAWKARDRPLLDEVYGHLTRLRAYLKTWPGGSPRWIKMGMVVLGLPGAAGGLRGPYRMPPAEDVKRFAAGLFALGIPEFDAS